MSSSTSTSSPLQFRATLRFRLARLGLLLCALIFIVLIAATGAGTEGQPGLLVFLMLVVGVFVVVAAIVAVAGWRLQVILDGQLLRSPELDAISTRCPEHSPGHG